jgi:N-acetylneuraminic acid mutarotase
MPTSRQEVGVGILDGKIYVVGGISGGVGVNTVERFDPVANSWESATVADLPAPDPLHHVAVTAAGGYLYAIGGYHGSFNAVDSVYRYDPVSNTWTPRASLPAAQGSMAAVTIGGIIYAVGGTPNTNVLVSYNPGTNSWSVLNPLPTQREHHAAAAVDGRLYVIGGRNGPNLSANEMYDPGTGLWISRAPLPTARGGIAAAVVEGRILVFGGEGNGADPNGIFDEVEMYNPADNTWTTLTPMPQGRHGIGAAVYGRDVHIPGGGPIAGLSDTDRLDILTPPDPIPVELSVFRVD